MKKIDAQKTISHQKVCRFNKKHYLCTHENPPSLFTMLKSAGRFIFLWHIIQKPTHRPSIDGIAMGFPRGWESEPLWQ